MHHAEEQEHGTDVREELVRGNSPELFVTQVRRKGTRLYSGLPQVRLLRQFVRERVQCRYNSWGYLVGVDGISGDDRKVSRETAALCFLPL